MQFVVAPLAADTQLGCSRHPAACEIMRRGTDSHRPPVSKKEEPQKRRLNLSCLFPLYVIIALGWLASLRLRPSERVPTGDTATLDRARAAGQPGHRRLAADAWDMFQGQPPPFEEFCRALPKAPQCTQRRWEEWRWLQQLQKCRGGGRSWTDRGLVICKAVILF